MINTKKKIKEVAFKSKASQFNGITIDDDLPIQNSNNIILLMHGWLDNSSSFLPLFEHLNINNSSPFKIIALDLPGHGKSPHRSSDSHYHFVDWIYDLLALLETNNWPSVHLVGHSMGGMISSSFSAVFPEKVKSLTLIDSIGVLINEAEKTTELFREGLLSRLNKTPESKKSVSIERAAKARMKVSDLQYEHAEMIVTRNLSCNSSSDCYWHSDRRLTTVSPYRFCLAQSKELIGNIKAPALVIHGSKGLDVIKKGLDIYAPLISCKKIVELEGGHHVHMEKPEETAALINDFISSYSP